MHANLSLSLCLSLYLFVSLQVTMMPRETGFLYFAGLSYTLNRVHCCQLLVRQSDRLDALLSSKGFVGGPQGAQGAPTSCQGGPLQGLDIRFREQRCAAATAAAAAAAAEDPMPSPEFIEAAGELLE